MALFENFPYSNLQQLNLDWIIEQLNQISSSAVLSVNGQTGIVTLYENAQMLLPNVPEDNWSIIRMCDGTHRGILFGNDDRAYIVHGSLMAQIYSQNNQPPYPVTKVNGQYGDVELYTEQYVRLPDLTDAQMQNWTFFRMLNNVSHGIQFNDDGTASIINGTSRYVLYSSQNPPPYPVDSVNGQTGTVVLFTDVNGAVGYPEIDDPGLEAWSIERNLNGTVLGLKLDENGYLSLKVGNNEYAVYTTNNPATSYVEDAEETIQQISEDSTNDFWGLMRETTEGSVGIMFENSNQNDPTAYIAYVDSNNTQQTVKLVTVDDLPATGVYSVNAKSGIVTLYGTDIEVSNTDNRSIVEAINDSTGLIAILETTNTATHNINVGQYVIWKNQLQICTTTISIGDTLSVSNLTPVGKTVFDMYTDIVNDMATIFLGNGFTSVADIESALDDLNDTLADSQWKFIRLGCASIAKPFTSYKTYCGHIMRINANNYTAILIDQNDEEIRIAYQNGTRYVYGDPELVSFSANATSLTTLAGLTAYINTKSTGDIAIVGLAPALLTSLIGTSTTRAGVGILYKASSSNTYYMVFESQHVAIGNYNVSTNTATPVSLA